jgi:hypothetical protein
MMAGGDAGDGGGCPLLREISSRRPVRWLILAFSRGLYGCNISFFLVSSCGIVSLYANVG